MKLYFVRHGESTANLLMEFCNGSNRHPLTKTGIAQARATVSNLHGITIDRIYTSPVLRAMQMAQILSDELRAPLEISEALREWSVGIYEGTSDPLGWELYSQVQEDWFVYHKLESKLPGGESYSEIRERFVPFINKLLQNGIGSQKNIVLVGHGGLYTAMLPVIFCNVTHDFACRHGYSYTATAVAEPRPEGLYCISWCGVKIDG